jgi:hypothetical protein
VYLETFLQEPSKLNKLKLAAINTCRTKPPKTKVHKRKKPSRPYKQGVFKPKNSLKFDGKAAIYRSSYELKFFRWCDENVNVLKWGSENVVIPYVNPNTNKLSKYFVDSFIVLKEGSKHNKYLIEIKPFKQTRPPNPSRYRNKDNLLYEQTMWNQNQAKWDAANKWAKKHSAEFIILTEKELNI